MKNKAHFVKQLCSLKGLDPESEEAKDLYSLKVLELLMEIKKYGPSIVTEKEQKEETEKTLAELLGCCS